jgi:hypothetical protein
MTEAETLPRAEAVEALTSFCYDFLTNHECQFSDDNVSVPKIVEVIKYAARDLGRVSHDLSDKVAREKYAAYHAFWFAKLKPISSITEPESGQEIVDINERCAVVLALDLVNQMQIIDQNDNELPSPLVWKSCMSGCGGACFKSSANDFLRFNKYQNFEYLVHSLRHRAMSPYGIVAFLDSLVVSSCEEVRRQTHIGFTNG